MTDDKKKEMVISHQDVDVALPFTSLSVAEEPLELPLAVSLSASTHVEEGVVICEPTLVETEVHSFPPLHRQGAIHEHLTHESHDQTGKCPVRVKLLIYPNTLVVSTFYLCAYMLIYNVCIPTMILQYQSFHSYDHPFISSL